jgi:flavorubredoxin
MEEIAQATSQAIGGLVLKVGEVSPTDPQQILTRRESSMKTLVIYDSFFGNTEKIALEIGAGFGERGEVETLPVSQVTPEKVQGLDSLIVGSPTRGFRPTKRFQNS